MVKRIVLVGVAVTAIGIAVACESKSNQGEHREAREDHERNEHRGALVTPAMLERGRAIYKANCAPCHGENGRGDGPAAATFKPKPRDHTDAAYMQKLTDADLTKTIQYGGSLKGMPLMPPSPQIKGAEMDALLAYVRSLSTQGRSAAGAGQ
jgi:cytochrome c5